MTDEINGVCCTYAFYYCGALRITGRGVSNVWLERALGKKELSSALDRQTLLWRQSDRRSLGCFLMSVPYTRAKSLGTHDGSIGGGEGALDSWQGASLERLFGGNTRPDMEAKWLAVFGPRPEVARLSRERAAC